MHELIFFTAILWVSFCFAKLEIEIEGAHGWAEKLPTKRFPQGHWISAVFFEGRPATGYHVWTQTFILSMMHLVYLFAPFSVATEFQVLAFFCFFWTLEDFLWFVLNPAFGIRNFRPEKIWWHERTWLWIAPRGYYILLIIGGLLYAASLYLA